MKLFPKMNILNRLEMKLGLSKSLLKIMLITLLLALIIYVVKYYYDNYFLTVLENYDSEELEIVIRNAFNDAQNEMTSTIATSLDAVNEETQLAMVKAINKIEAEIEEANTLSK